MHSPHFVMLISGIFTVNRVHSACFFLVLIYLSRCSGQLSHWELFCCSALCYFSQCVGREFSGIWGFFGSTWQMIAPFLLTSIGFSPVQLLFWKAAKFMKRVVNPLKHFLTCRSPLPPVEEQISDYFWLKTLGFTSRILSWDLLLSVWSFVPGLNDLGFLPCTACGSNKGCGASRNSHGPSPLLFPVPMNFGLLSCPLTKWTNGVLSPLNSTMSSLLFIFSFSFFQLIKQIQHPSLFWRVRFPQPLSILVALFVLFPVAFHLLLFSNLEPEKGQNIPAENIPAKIKSRKLLKKTPADKFWSSHLVQNIDDVKIQFMDQCSHQRTLRKTKRERKKGENTRLKMLFISVLVCVIVPRKGKSWWIQGSSEQWDGKHLQWAGT